MASLCVLVLLNTTVITRTAKISEGGGNDIEIQCTSTDWCQVHPLQWELQAVAVSLLLIMQNTAPRLPMWEKKTAIHACLFSPSVFALVLLSSVPKS